MKTKPPTKAAVGFPVDQMAVGIEPSVTETPPVPRFVSLAVVEGVDTQDSGMVRNFRAGSLRWRDVYALTWQRTSSHGEGDAGPCVRVGTIDASTREGDQIMCRGVLADSWEAEEFARAVEDGSAGWPSVRVSDDDVIVSDEPVPDLGPNVEVMPDLRVEFVDALLIELTIVQTQAQDGTWIRLDDTPADTQPAPVAAATPVRTAARTSAPPLAWFPGSHEGLDATEYQPVTVWPPVNGLRRVSGHLAPSWDACLVGYDTCVNPPHSPSGYGHFPSQSHGTLAVAEGLRINVAPLVMGKGHAGLDWDVRAAAAFYDGGPDATTVAWLVAGEDHIAPWVSGVIDEHLSDDDLERFLRLGISGDWREAEPGRGLDLIAVAAGIHTPGFQRPRAMAASARVKGEDVKALIITTPVRDAAPEPPAVVAASVVSRVLGPMALDALAVRSGRAAREERLASLAGRVTATRR